MRIIVTGGGTGGHIFPALSLIDNIKKHHDNYSFLYVGTSNGLEADIVPKYNIDMSYIEVAGFKRALTIKNIQVIYNFIVACIKAKKILKKFKPNIVIGTGGYVSAPVVYMASKLNIPTIIHEQNVIPGLTNKFLARYADVVAVSFDESKNIFTKAKKVLFTGNPRASSIVEAEKSKGLEFLNIGNKLPIVVVLGGSRGAKKINDSMEELLSIDTDLPFNIVFVTGNIHYDRFKNKETDNILIYPFLYNMPEILACADLVVGRAGATFLSEVTALGIPSILIPSPYVTNNHQYHNAMALSKVGAAVVIKEQNLNGKILQDVIYKTIMDKNKLADYKAASKKLGNINAADNLRVIIEEITSR